MVLVTGASGLLGSHVLLEILKEGQKVKALLRPEQRDNADHLEKLFFWYGAEYAQLLNRVEWVFGDLLDIPALEDILEGVHTVYHCAGKISFDPADEKELLRINLEGTRNLVNVCLDFGVSNFCHVSSISTLVGNDSIQTEAVDDAPYFLQGYAGSKYLSEMEVWRAGQEGLNVVIVNPGVILGPGIWTRGSGKFFSETQKGMRFCPPGGTGFVGAEDVARVMLALVRNKAFGERFIIIAENDSYYKILRKIAQAIGASPPKTILKNWHLEILWRLDKLRVLLGGKNRRLTRATARGLRHTTRYSNEKVCRTLDFEFQKLDEVILKTATHFLNTES